jgi:hemerythrin superfamily protein
MTETVEPDVVDLLLAQHTEIEALFAEVLTALGERKRELFQELVRMLAVHETVEEELVHPRIRVEIEAAEPVVERRLAEEQAAKRELASLYDLGVDHVDFDRRLTALAKDVLAHATREEQEEFGYLRVALPAAELRRLANAMRAAQALAPTRPHPSVPPSALANLLVGPPLMIFDKIRDAVRDAREGR